MWSRGHVSGHEDIVTARDVCPCFQRIIASVCRVQTSQIVIKTSVRKKLIHVGIVSLLFKNAPKAVARHGLLEAFKQLVNALRINATTVVC